MSCNKNNILKKFSQDNRGGIIFNAFLVLLILAGIGLWVMLIAGILSGNYRYEEPETEPEIRATATPTPTRAPIWGDREDEQDEGDGEDGGEREPGLPSVGGGSAGIDISAAQGRLTETDIFHAFPGISNELDAISSSFKAMAVTLAVYDANTGDYYTNDYGYADASAARPIDIDTKVCAAQLTNLVTAVCVMTLVDNGLVDLDADLRTYMGYDFRNPNYPDTRITPRMLLTHTSSIFDSGAFNMSRNRNSSESVRTLIDTGRSFRDRRPGEVYEYSNFNFAVLGSLCELVSGKSLDTYAREKVFDPLGLDAAYLPSRLRDTENIAVVYESDHSIWRRVDSQLLIMESNTLGHDLHLASGNLTISAYDYAKIMAMLSSGGTFEGKEILSQQAVGEMHDATVDSRANHMQGLGVRYSEGEFIGDGGFYWHSGNANGIFSQFIYSDDENRGVVVISTGAAIRRLDNGKIDFCTELSQAAWGVFDGAPAATPAAGDDDAAENDDNAEG